MPFWKTWNATENTSDLSEKGGKISHLSTSHQEFSPKHRRLPFPLLPPSSWWTWPHHFPPAWCSQPTLDSVAGPDTASPPQWRWSQVLSCTGQPQVWAPNSHTFLSPEKDNTWFHLTIFYCKYYNMKWEIQSCMEAHCFSLKTQTSRGPLILSYSFPFQGKCEDSQGVCWPQQQQAGD